MRGRFAERKHSDGPSPIDYAPSFKQVRSASPSFSLRPRTAMLNTGGGSPDIAPNKYDKASAQASALRPRTPAFSMGERIVGAEQIAERIRSQLPAPNTYNVPTTVGVSPFWANTGGAPSFGARLNETHRDQSPSPIEYALPSTLDRSAVWKSAPLTSLATYGPRLATPLRAGTPSNVSPLSYDVPSSFSPRSDKAIFKSSGMGSSLGSRRFHGSVAQQATLVDSPAPDAYGVPRVSHREDPQPRFCRSARLAPGPSELSRAALPGPNAYLVDLSGVNPSAPRFSMRPRTSSAPGWSSQTPAPNAFNLQGVNLDRASPRFSIKLRWRPEKSNDIPGPGAYGTLRLPALEKLLERTMRFKSPYPSALETVRRDVYSRNINDSVTTQFLEESSVPSVHSMATSPVPFA